MSFSKGIGSNCPEFELGSPIPFSTTITVTLSVPHSVPYIIDSFADVEI